MLPPRALRITAPSLPRAYERRDVPNPIHKSTSVLRSLHHHPCASVRHPSRDEYERNHHSRDFRSGNRRWHASFVAVARLRAGPHQLGVRSYRASKCSVRLIIAKRIAASHFPHWLFILLTNSRLVLSLCWSLFSPSQCDRRGLSCSYPLESYRGVPRKKQIKARQIPPKKASNWSQLIFQITITFLMLCFPANRAVKIAMKCLLWYKSYTYYVVFNKMRLYLCWVAYCKVLRPLILYNHHTMYISVSNLWYVLLMLVWWPAQVLWKENWKKCQ